MAGHQPLDPAIIRAAEMHANRYMFFRFTRRTTRITLMYVVVVPALLGWAAYKTDGLIDFRAKRKGDTMFER